MSFVTIGLLWAGLACIAAPILVHLLIRRRRRPVEWAAMRFLLEAYHHHHRRLRIEQLLLLLVRCLIPLALGVALARPFIARAIPGTLAPRRAVLLVIDDSLTSALREPDGTTALQRHVGRATDIIGALEPGDAVGVISASRRARPILLPPSTDHASALKLLGSFKPTDAAADIESALALLHGNLDGGAGRFDHRICYLLSDFRAGSAQLDRTLPGLLADLPPGIELIAAPPDQSAGENIRIVDVQPARQIVLPGTTGELPQVRIHLARSGGALGEAVSRVRLSGEGLARDDASPVHWQPGQTELEVDIVPSITVQGDRTLAFTAGIDDDRLPADNRRFTVVQARRAIRVALVDQSSLGRDAALDRLSAGQWLHHALQPSDASPIDVFEVDPAALRPLDAAAADVVILARPDLLPEAAWSYLRSFVDGGGFLLVVPPAELNTHPWTARLAGEFALPWRIDPDAVEHDPPLALAVEQPATPLLRMIAGELADLARPVTAVRTLRVRGDHPATDAVLLFDGGSPMLLLSRPGPASGTGVDQRAEPSAAGPAGLVALLTVAPHLQWTSLPSKPFMVPLCHELIRQGLGRIQSDRRFTVAEQPVLSIARSGEELVGPEDERLSLTEGRRPERPFPTAGLYHLVDPLGRARQTIAVNIDPDAGRTESQSRAAVGAWLTQSGPWRFFDADDPTLALRRPAESSPLAALLLVLLLALLLLETILARRFSYAWRSSRTDAPGALRATINDPDVHPSLRLAAGSSSAPGGRP